MWRSKSKIEDAVKGLHESEPAAAHAVPAAGESHVPSAETQDFAETRDPAETRDFAETLAAIPLDWDDWELDEDLRAAERLTQDLQPASRRIRRTLSAESAPRAEPARRGAARTENPRPKKSGIVPGLAWAMLSLSVMTFVCGGVLVVWSVVAGRAELGQIGMPLTLLGQTGCLLSALLHLECLWQGQRESSKHLQELEQRFEAWETGAARGGHSDHGTAPSFYAHLGEGANPQLLLADLQGQIDLLASQLHRPRAA